MASLPQSKLSRVKFLYYEQEMSAREIAEVVGVSIDAMYYFMRHNNLVRRNLSEQNASRFKRKPPSFVFKRKLSQGEQSLKIAGIMLYWAEGFQSRDATIVDFANSKPEMIALFMKFLRHICGINKTKIRAYLYCFRNQNVPTLIRFWSKLTSIPKSQFTKPYVRKDFDVEKVGKMKYGLLHVRYYDKKLLNLLRVWISEYCAQEGII